MLIYVVGTILTVIFTIFAVDYEKCINKKERPKRFKYIKENNTTWDRLTIKVFKLFSVLPLMLIAGGRYRVGTDWGAYASSFISVSNGKRGFYGEVGYRLLQNIVAIFTSDYKWLFVVSAFIFVGFYFGGIYNMSVNPPASVALIVCTSIFFAYMNGMRQGMALAVLFYSLRYIFAKDTKRFLLFLMIATSFHISSLFFVVVLVLSHMEINVKTVIKYTLIFSGVGIAGGEIVEFFIRQTKYGHYYESRFADEGFEILWFLINVTILIVTCIYQEHARKSIYAYQYNVLMWMQMLAVIFCLISSSVPGANRVIWMFNIGQLLLLPLIARLEEDKNWSFILNFLMISFYAIATFIAITRGSHRVLPYRTYFF